MSSVACALLAAAGTYLMVSRPPVGRDRPFDQRLRLLHTRAVAALRQAGLESISPAQFALTVTSVGAVAAGAAALVL